MNRTRSNAIGVAFVITLCAGSRPDHRRMLAVILGQIAVERRAPQRVAVATSAPSDGMRRMASSHLASFAEQLM